VLLLQHSSTAKCDCEICVLFFNYLQALNLILLTSTELGELRSLLKKSLVDSCGKDLFQSLYASWRHSPMATISLCLLAQAYSHASCVIQSLGEEDINVKFLVQLDKLIRLLETPVFAYLRLQLLEPGKHTWLLKTLYGLLMLLPQVCSISLLHCGSYSLSLLNV